MVWPLTNSHPAGAVVMKPIIVIPAGMGTVESCTQPVVW
jgi:hypothetical protein